MDWQVELCRQLASLARGEPWTQRVVKAVTWTVRGGALSMTSRCPSSPYDEGWPLLRAMEDLAAATKPLRMCGNEACRRWFIRTKRQLYCSSTCTRTVTTRRYRERKRRKLNTQQPSQSSPA
jgi:hypothetical protein